MLVQNYMTRDVRCVLEDDSLDDVHALMVELGVRHLPVLAHNALTGIVSDRDLLVHAQRRDKRLVFPEHLCVRDIMSQPVVTCSMDTELADAAAKMIDLKIDALPITDSRGHLVGLLTTTDVLRLCRDLRPTEPPLHREPGPHDMDLPESLI